MYNYRWLLTNEVMYTRKLFPTGSLSPNFSSRMIVSMKLKSDLPQYSSVWLFLIPTRIFGLFLSENETKYHCLLSSFTFRTYYYQLPSCFHYNILSVCLYRFLSLTRLPVWPNFYVFCARSGIIQSDNMFELFQQSLSLRARFKVAR